MKTIETTAVITDDGVFATHAPEGLAAGNYHVVIIIDDAPPAAKPVAAAPVAEKMSEKPVAMKVAENLPPPAPKPARPTPAADAKAEPVSIYQFAVDVLTHAQKFTAATPAGETAKQGFQFLLTQPDTLIAIEDSGITCLTDFYQFLTTVESHGMTDKLMFNFNDISRSLAEALERQLAEAA